MHDFSKTDWRDILERGGKTFIQAFVATWLVAGQPLSREAVVSALAAAISVTWNWVKATA